MHVTLCMLKNESQGHALRACVYVYKQGHLALRAVSHFLKYSKYYLFWMRFRSFFMSETESDLNPTQIWLQNVTTWRYHNLAAWAHNTWPGNSLKMKKNQRSDLWAHCPYPSSSTSFSPMHVNHKLTRLIAMCYEHFQ